MRFSIDFATGLVICNSCSSPMKVHVDDLENGKTYSTNFRNKECFYTAKKFVTSVYFYSRSYDKSTGKVKQYECPECDCNEE
jgi:hypothetical protein